MERAKKFVRLVGAWAVVFGGPGCAFLDEWDDYDCDCYEVEYHSELPPAAPAPPPPVDPRGPGIYRESR